MTAMQMATVGGGFTPTQGATHNLSHMLGPANTFIPNVTFLNDGTTTYLSNAGVTTPDTPWGLPTTPGIGSFYWIRFTNTSGAGVYNGVGVGATWNSLAAGVSIGINAAGPGLAVSRVCSYDIASDAAGATIVASGSCNFASDRT